MSGTPPRWDDTPTEPGGDYGEPLHAVVLAGGPGRRLPPYETLFPKALVPLGEKHAVIEVVLRQLQAQGFSHVTLAIGHLGSLVRAYCDDGSQWDLKIDYWWEDEPLGTMGPIVAHLDDVPENFLVINGDVLTDLDCRKFLLEHAQSDAPISVATSERTIALDFGLVELGGDGDRSIVAFQEKPVRNITVSTGIYAVSRETLRRYEPGTPLGFDELVLDLIERREFPRAVPFDGLWLDVGVTDEYQRANADWGELGPRLLPARPAGSGAADHQPRGE
jgi:NDP-mannose synthase